MQMQPAIAVRELTKTYAEGSAGTLALRGVDVEVHAGELLMLIGPSGSGKTTLLSIMGCMLTAGENVELMLDLKGVAAASAKKRAAELLDQVGLAGKHDSFPADLSGGQKQRVAIARALSGDPRIILADEPTAALDSHTGKNVMEMMSELAHKRGRAVVIVTHDSRVLNFADRIVKIEDGAIAQPLEVETVPAGMLVHNALQPSVNLV